MHYKVASKTFWHPLGEFAATDAPPSGQLTLEQARSHAAAWRPRIRSGEHPHDVAKRERDLKERAKSARSAAPTVAETVELFRERYLMPKTNRPDDRLIALRKHVLSKIGDAKLADVQRRDLNGILDEVVAGGRYVIAYALSRLLGQFFRWAVDREYLAVSPAERLVAGNRHTPRDRVLHEDEIRLFWSQFDRTDLPMTTALRLALKVILVTGVRSQEIALARWEHVDLEGDMPGWTIPATAAKEAVAHFVPLGPTAVRLLQSLESLTDDTQWVLPHGERVHGEERLTERKVKPTGPLDSHAIATALRRTLRKINGLKDGKNVPPDFKYKLRPFGAHDLRRTLRTGLSRLGIASDLAERVIGHTVGSMLLKTYDLYDQLNLQ
jgi:integrase